MKNVLAFGLLLAAIGILLWLFFRLNPSAKWEDVINFGLGAIAFVLGFGALLLLAATEERK